jgi:hypothetical protein
MRLHFRSSRQRNTWPQQLDGEKHRVTPHPLGAHNFSTVARCLGNQIIGVEVRVRSILLRYTMTVTMRYVRMERYMLIWSSLMMIVTLAQRLVILAPLRSIVTLAHWRDSWVDKTVAPMS